MIHALSIARRVGTRTAPRARRRYGDWSTAALLLPAVLRSDGRSLWFGVIACGIAATVATFQFSVFTSFLAAGSAAPRYLDADAWITDRGIECFDFPTTIADGYRGALLAELPGARFERVVVGFTTWVSPSGARGNVAVIGRENAGLATHEFRVDLSDLKRLQLDDGAGEASIGGVTVQLAGTTDRLATFLGAPYVEMAFDTAHAVLGYPIDSTAYLAVRFPAGVPADLSARLKRLERRFPEISARTGADFARSSSSYWQNKTGAGAAILLAAILASLLMVLLLVNSVGRFVQRRQADIVSMLGHGASTAQIGNFLLAMAGFLIACSLALAVALVPLTTIVAHPWLPWVSFTPVDALFAVVIAATCLVASLIVARRELERFPADAVFRS